MEFTVCWQYQNRQKIKCEKNENCDPGNKKRHQLLHHLKYQQKYWNRNKKYQHPKVREQTAVLHIRIVGEHLGMIARLYVTVSRKRKYAQIHKKPKLIFDTFEKNVPEQFFSSLAFKDRLIGYCQTLGPIPDITQPIFFL